MALLRCSVGFLLLLGLPLGWAQPVSDEFSDGQMGIGWGFGEVFNDAQLREFPGTLEFSAPATPDPNDFAQAAWVWQGTLPSDEDWEAWAEVEITAAYPTVSLGLFVTPAGRTQPEVFVEMYSNVFRGFFAAQEDVSGSVVGDSVNSQPSGTTQNALVRLTYDGDTGVVTCYYDNNGPAGGNVWTEFASYGTRGSGGSTDNLDWGLSAGERLQVGLYGFSLNNFVFARTMFFNQFFLDGNAEFSGTASGKTQANVDGVNSFVDRQIDLFLTQNDDAEPPSTREDLVITDFTVTFPFDPSVDYGTFVNHGSFVRFTPALGFDGAITAEYSIRDLQSNTSSSELALTLFPSSTVNVAPTTWGMIQSFLAILRDSAGPPSNVSRFVRTHLYDIIYELFRDDSPGVEPFSSDKSAFVSSQPLLDALLEPWEQAGVALITGNADEATITPAMTQSLQLLMGAVREVRPDLVRGIELIELETDSFNALSGKSVGEVASDLGVAIPDALPEVFPVLAENGSIAFDVSNLNGVKYRLWRFSELGINPTEVTDAQLTQLGIDGELLRIIDPTAPTGLRFYFTTAEPVSKP
ncbi:MAG: hypothetical protein ACFB21_09650 [Opitutales bacterium]